MLILFGILAAPPGIKLVSKDFQDYSAGGFPFPPLALRSSGSGQSPEICQPQIQPHLQLLLNITNRWHNVPRSTKVYYGASCTAHSSAIQPKGSEPVR